MLCIIIIIVREMKKKSSEVSLLDVSTWPYVLSLTPPCVLCWRSDHVHKRA